MKPSSTLVMGKSQRVKGVRGELEVFKVIEQELGISLRRNSQEQYEEGGSDFQLGLYSCEVKRQEKLSLKAWWGQAVEDARANNLIPCLIYRQSRQPWRAIIPFCSTSMMFNEYCEGCTEIHPPEWGEDYEYTQTILLAPMFTSIVREQMAAMAMAEMQGGDTRH